MLMQPSWLAGHDKPMTFFLLLQMGKFYELFHMDSTTGVEELGLMYMKVPDQLFQWRLSAFSLCSSGLVCSLLVLSAVCLFMKVSLKGLRDVCVRCFDRKLLQIFV